VATAAFSLSVEAIEAHNLPAVKDFLLDVYAEVYADQLDDPFFSLPRYWERLQGYAARDGFSIVIGRVGESVTGYALGYTLPAASQWWRGLRAEVDPDLLREDGHRTFAVTEIMVLADHRRRGYAGQLHDALVSDRDEQRATLLVLPDNAPAKAAYESWGWFKLGELQPFDDAPVYDAMMLDLKRRSPKQTTP
jgi:ribosomal protein S18 acetylase RimI-like enzyme